MLHVVVFNMLLLGCCGYALMRGGAPEQIAAGLQLAAALLTPLMLSGINRRFAGVEYGVFAVDAVLLFALVGVALFADRGWPMALAALQLDTTAVHLLKMVDPNVIPVTYALMMGVWSYPMLVIMAIGTARHRRRLKRTGTDRAWSARI